MDLKDQFNLSENIHYLCSCKKPKILCSYQFLIF